MKWTRLFFLCWFPEYCQLSEPHSSSPLQTPCSASSRVSHEAVSGSPRGSSPPLPCVASWFSARKFPESTECKLCPPSLRFTSSSACTRSIANKFRTRLRRGFSYRAWCSRIQTCRSARIVLIFSYHRPQKCCTLTTFWVWTWRRIFGRWIPTVGDPCSKFPVSLHPCDFLRFASRWGVHPRWRVRGSFIWWFWERWIFRCLYYLR